MRPIPVALLQLGWCLTGDGRVSFWCWGRAGLLPTAGCLFGKASAGPLQEPGNPHPLERLVLPGVELDGWKTELKMASLGSRQGLAPALHCAASRSVWGGARSAHPARWSVASLGVSVTLHPGLQQNTRHLGQAGTGGGLMSQSLVGLLLESPFSTRVQQK